MKSIGFKRPDGTVRIVAPAIQPQAGEAEQAFLQRIADHAIAADNPTDDVPLRNCVLSFADTMPTTRRWRPAWTVTGAAVTVDMSLARQGRKQELQGLAKQRDAELTRQIQDTEDNGGNPGQLRQKRRALRQLDLDAALATKTLQELDTFIPQELSAG